MIAAITRVTGVAAAAVIANVVLIIPEGGNIRIYKYTSHMNVSKIERKG